MRIKLLTFFLVFATSLSAYSVSSIVKPETDKYYKIKHISGLYLSDVSFNARVLEPTGDNSQIVKFIPVEGEENVYNMVRLRSGLFYGSDKNWNSTIISRNIPLSQFEILPSEVVEGCVVIRNIGLSDYKT